MIAQNDRSNQIACHFSQTTWMCGYFDTVAARVWRPGQARASPEMFLLKKYEAQCLKPIFGKVYNSNDFLGELLLTNQ